MPSNPQVRTAVARFVAALLVLLFAVQTVSLAQAIRQNWTLLSQRETESPPVQEQAPGSNSAITIAAGARAARSKAGAAVGQSTQADVLATARLARRSNLNPGFLAAGRMCGRLKC